MRLARATVVVITLALASCLPYPTWYWEAVRIDQYNLAPDAEDAIEVGDKVRVRNKHTGKSYRFTVHQLRKKGFVGTAKNNHNYELLYDDLSLLEVERMGWNIATRRGLL
jgi:hypothetical protein